MLIILLRVIPVFEEASQSTVKYFANLELHELFITLRKV